jgi:sterol desaturase/sphingolipid hydroxylase (fatty acid hydroxylase superfamily)
LGYALAIFVGGLIGDFFFYWMHRAQHAWFWRFHAVHHSIEDLNAIASYHHVTEELIRAVFIYVPTGLLVTDAGALGPFLTDLVVLQGFYIHSCTRLHLGPLRYLIGDNAFHRIHHSNEPHHFAKNFSGFSPIWDVVFGTAYFPQPGEWPATGLAGRQEPGSIGEYVMQPFVRRRDAAPQS